MKGALRWFGKVLMRQDVPWTPAQARRANRLAASQVASLGVGTAAREAMSLAAADQARGRTSLSPETIAAADKVSAAGRGTQDPEARDLLTTWRSGLDALPMSWILPDDGGASADLASKANALIRRFGWLEQVVVDSESDLWKSYPVGRIQFGPPDLSTSLTDFLFKVLRRPDPVIADLELDPGLLEIFRVRRTSPTAPRDIHFRLTGSTTAPIPPALRSWSFYSIWAPINEKALTGEGVLTYDTESGSQPSVTTIKIEGSTRYRLE